MKVALHAMIPRILRCITLGLLDHPPPRYISITFITMPSYPTASLHIERTGSATTVHDRQAPFRASMNSLGKVVVFGITGQVVFFCEPVGPLQIQPNPI